MPQSVSRNHGFDARSAVAAAVSDTGLAYFARPQITLATCQARPDLGTRLQFAERLKTKISRTPVPVPASLGAELSAHIARYGRHETLLTGQDGRQLSPWPVERAMRTARKKVLGLPAGFRYHDLRHYCASLLIASGADVKTVQARLCDASAKTALDYYGHI